MSMQYILDGYNVLYQTDIEPALPVDEQRRILIDKIESSRPHGSWNNELTIIFDGRPGPGWRTPVTSFRVVFSMDESADDFIRRMLDNKQSNITAVVVTDDRELQSSVKARNGQVMAVHEFLARMTKKPYHKSVKNLDQSRNSGKYISKTSEYKITKEMEGIWLNKGRKEDVK